MSVPSIVNDGDFTVPQQNGAPVISFPFAYRGDTKTFIARVPYRVDENYYKTPIPMSQRWFPNLGNAYLVDIDQPQMNGQRLLDYGLIYANIPQRGVEYGSTTMAIQKPVIAPYGDNSTITQYNDTFDALNVYEYSVFTPLPQLFYARFILAPFSLPPDNFQAVFVAGSTAYQTPTPVNGTLLQLSQNSTTKIYKGQIYERLTVWARISLAESYPRILVIPPGP